MLYEVEGLVCRIGGRAVLDKLSFGIAEGRMTGIIGPNGAGKSTLLGVLSGVVPIHEGHVRLRGRPIGSYGRKELARWAAVLRQEGLPAALFTVREVVGMGRFPFQNWLGHEEADAASVIERAIRAMGLESLAERRLDQLSGGERQRVALAQVMAQEPRLILLDEPTTYLDIGYQVQLLDTVRAWQRRDGLTAIAVLHDLNLASQYCDELLVLKDGRMAAYGPPADVLTEATISQVYGTEPVVLAHPVGGRPQVLLKPQHGNESAKEWEA